MTPLEIINCALERIGLREPTAKALTMEEQYIRQRTDRIDNQVQLMKEQALSTSAALTGFRDRLLDLELRNEQVDATYIRTVTLALSENLEKRDAAISDRYNRLEASFAAAELDLRNQIATATERYGNLALNWSSAETGLRTHIEETRQRCVELENKLDALIRKLRAGLE